jgi:hypothetical protein
MEMEFSQRTSVEATEPNVIVELGSYRWIILLIAWISFLISFVDRLEKVRTQHLSLRQPCKWGIEWDLCAPQLLS